jgi:hypothetical protein
MKLGQQYKLIKLFNDSRGDVTIGDIYKVEQKQNGALYLNNQNRMYCWRWVEKSDLFRSHWELVGAKGLDLPEWF